MEKIYKDGEVLEATDLNGSFSELETKINSFIEEYTRDPFIIIGGKKYPLSGAIPGSKAVLYANYIESIGSVHSAHLIFPAPYTPPPGFTFQMFALESKGFIHLSTEKFDRAKNEIYAIWTRTGGTGIEGLVTAGWRLVSLSEDPNRLANQY